MVSTSVGIFVIDFILRPFAKIFEKMPIVVLLLVLLLYAIIGYMVLKSVYFADQQS